MRAILDTENLVYLMLLICCAAAVGYVINAKVLICECDFEPPYKAEIIRGAGLLVPPLGAFFGYMDIDGCTKIIDEELSR